MNEKTLLSAADDATNLNGEANAHLIASAPALKASLREALKLLQWYRDNTRTSPEVDIATGISMSFFYKVIEKSEGKHPVYQEGAL